MAQDLAQLWWVFATKGFVSLAFAGFCYLLTSATASQLLRPLGYLYLLVFFSLYVCVNGIILLVGAVYAFDFKLDHRRLLLANAIIELVIGAAFLLTFGFGFSFSCIVVLFALHAAALGIIYLLMAIQAGGPARIVSVLGAAAVWSILAGIYLILFHSMSPEKLVLAGSIYSVIFGGLLLLFAIDLRTAHRLLMSNPAT